MRFSFFFLVIPLALLLSGCILNPTDRVFPYEPIKTHASPAGRTIAENAAPAEDPYGDYETVNISVGQCFLMPDDFYKTRCFTQAAVYLKDLSLCENVNEEYRPACHLSYAVENADAAACSFLDETEYGYPGLSENCRRGVGIFTGNSSLCVYHPQEPEGAQKAGLCSYFAGSKLLVGKEECREDIPAHLLGNSVYFGETYKWLVQSHPGETVLSWWDYGSTLDCAGLKSIISNADLNDPEILEAAYLYVAGNESELAAFMKANGARYVMVDSELLFSGNSFGGKYGALNYLSCAYMNGTDAGMSPGVSSCETELLWEMVYAPTDSSGNACIISEKENKTGVLAYHIYLRNQLQGSYDLYTPYYPSICLRQSEYYNAEYCDEYVRAEPAYCIGEMVFADGTVGTGLYKLDETDESGNLKPNKALYVSLAPAEETYHFGDATSLLLAYTKDKLWLENGTAVDGYSDAEYPFYHSVIYKALILDELDGFKKVYTSPFTGGVVKIFELEE